MVTLNIKIIMNNFAVLIFVTTDTSIFTIRVGMCTGVIVHDLSCSILFYPVLS